MMRRLRRFKAMASELGVEERVAFGGFRRDMPTALGAADIFFFPSRYEAFSLATIEAGGMRPAAGGPLASTGLRILSPLGRTAGLSNMMPTTQRKC